MKIPEDEGEQYALGALIATGIWAFFYLLCNLLNIRG